MGRSLTAFVAEKERVVFETKFRWSDQTKKAVGELQHHS